MDQLGVGDMSHFLGAVDREQTFLPALMKEIFFPLTDGCNFLICIRAAKVSDSGLSSSL